MVKIYTHFQTRLACTISNENGQNLHLFSDQKLKESKNIPFGATHAYIVSTYL